MDLLREITYLSELFWEGKISADVYYRLVDITVRLHNLEKLSS